MMTTAMHKRGFTGPDEGATLLLTMAFIFVLGILFVALAGFASNAFRNTSNFKYQRTVAADAETLATASIQYLRTNYGSDGFYNLSAQSCPGTSSSIGSANPASGLTNSLVLVCVASSDPRKAATRTVDLYACPSGTSVGSCSSSSSLILHAEAVYNDYTASGSYSCDSRGTSTCGTAMTISAWDVAYADN